LSSRRRQTSCSGDWSSDVCSSDLLPQGVEAVRVGVRRHPLVRWMNLDEPSAELNEAVHVARRVLREAGVHAAVREQSRWIGLGRSEERRVGEEGGGGWRVMGSVE